MSLLYAQVHLSLPVWVQEVVDTHQAYADDAAKMALAIRLAERNVEQGSGGPFGAAVFTASGRLVAVGVNRVVAARCSLAHAELLALMTAQQRLQRHRLDLDGEHFVLASSAQPCCQCYGAIIWAGLARLIIGARAEDVHELTDFDEGPLPADWIGELTRRGITVVRDVARERARAVLAAYREAGGVRY